jgi:redox-sensing transcriptional repressor
VSILPFSIQTLKRLPFYLSLLEDQSDESVTSGEIARILGLTEVQVRKDLAAISQTAGTPGRGFSRSSLIRDIKIALGYGQLDEAAIAGVGHLGTALVNYDGIKQYGLRIVVGFDIKVAKKTWIHETPVYPAHDIVDVIRRMKIRLGIITVNRENAQTVCDSFIEAGIKAIWNFSPTILRVPDDVIVQNENLAASLALLSRHLKAGGHIDPQSK